MRRFLVRLTAGCATAAVVTGLATVLAAAAPASAQPAFAGYLFTYFTDDVRDHRRLPDLQRGPGMVRPRPVARVGGTYYRYTKDERQGGTCGQFITSHTSTSLRSTGWGLQAECIGQGTLSRGEGPLVFKSNTEDRWYLFIDEFGGGRGYVPFQSTNLASGQWTPVPSSSLPSSPRHGTVLPVTQAEYDRLLQAYGGGGAATFTSRHSGKCIDVVSASTADGAEIAQYACNSGANQRWQLQDAGDGYVRLVAQHSGKCLDVEGGSTADRARVLQWACHSGSNQQWQAQGEGSGYLRLVARHSGKCLDVAGWSTADGTRLQQWSCHDGANQQWQQGPA